MHAGERKAALSPCDRQSPFGAKSPEPKDSSRFARAPRRNHPRQEFNAEPGAGQFGDEVDLAAARHNGWLEPLTSTRVENDPIERETRLEQDERRVAQTLRTEIGPHVARAVAFFLAACRRGGVN